MRINVHLPDELAAEIERLRGDVSRSLWIRRAVEQATGKAAPATARRSSEGVERKRTGRGKR